jgi:hypothetical protein
MATRFADTTALFEWYAGTGVSRAAARKALGPRREVVTSDHVQREWKRIVVNAVGAVVEAAETEPDLAAMFARLGRGFGREPAQRQRALALVSGGTNSINATDIKIRGRQALREVDARVRRRVGSIRSASACGLAVAEPRQAPDGRWTVKQTCKRGEGICDHEARLDQDLPRWCAGAQALVGSSSNGLRTMGHTALKMADGPELRTGSNCYQRTGDLAIALDCRRDEVLVTTDKSFLTLGSAMGFAVDHLPT